MSTKKKVLMVMPHMVGGGAERVAAQIMNKLNERGYDTRFILTSAKKNEVVRTDLNEKTQLILLTEEMKAETTTQKLSHFPARVYSTIFGKLYEKQNKYVPASVGKATIDWQYHREIAWLRNYLKQNPDMPVILFLQPAIPIVILAAENLPNRIIVSERMDPNRLMRKRYGKCFLEKYYTRADSIVFQTNTAMHIYPEILSNKGTVIPNPLKKNLPEPYHGERDKVISTFCRIHPDKDLITLLKAFDCFHKVHSDFSLRIIGDAKNKTEIRYRDELIKYVKEHNLEESVLFVPFTPNVHQEIIRDAMYVNSSVSEGLSNAMLESLAIGLPVICTDCPVGGAKDTIINGKNGLLVSMKNPQELCDAMSKIANDNQFALNLSKNAARIRDDLELGKVVDKWEKLIK